MKTSQKIAKMTKTYSKTADCLHDIELMQSIG